MKSTKGFTLIEMMIVVAIIAIICAIAVPNLLRSKIQANEAATIEDLSVIAEAQISFNAGKLTFTSFAGLTDDSNGPPFLDQTWSEGRVKNGYVFSITSANASSFVCFADPDDVGVTGSKYYRVDTSGIIRSNPTGRPSSTDPPVGG
jgi:prepilin-type N-terminal cleavage/methylation domain-containing protein